MTESSSAAGLSPGGVAIVRELSARGALRRRLQDLGFVPGAKVECLGHSPLGDPRAYRVRGMVIALRGSDAEAIQVRPLWRGA